MAKSQDKPKKQKKKPKKNKLDKFIRDLYT